MSDKKIQDLGWANGWQGTPDIVTQCRAARESGEKHEMAGGAGPWHCTHVTTCLTCGYTFKVDSSG